MKDSSSEHQYPNFYETGMRPWREISAIALLLMDVSWLIAWHSSVFQPDERLSKGSLYILYGSIVFTIYLLASFMQWIQLRANVRRAALLMLLLGGYFFMLSRLLYVDDQFSVRLVLSNLQASFADAATILPPELVILTLCTYLVFRSARLVSSWIGQAVVRRRFQLGIVLLLLLGTISRFLIDLNVTAEILVFLIASFIALGAARVSTLSALRGGVQQRVSLPSIISVSFSAILIAVLGFLLGDFASVNLSALTAMIFFASIRLLFILIVVVLSPVIFLVAFLVTWLGGNLGASPILRAIELEILNLFGFFSSIIDNILAFIQGIDVQLPDLGWLRPYVLWGLMAVVLFILLKEFGRSDFTVRKLRAVIVEERTSLTGYSLRSWFRKLLEERLDRISSRLNSLNQRSLLGALRIRRIYAQLMKVCERLEQARPATATPLEYLEELEKIFPKERAQVRRITHAYNRVRYGELPETAEEVQAVERAWRVVRVRAKDLLAVRKQLGGGDSPQ